MHVRDLGSMYVQNLARTTKVTYMHVRDFGSMYVPNLARTWKAPCARKTLTWSVGVNRPLVDEAHVASARMYPQQFGTTSDHPIRLSLRARQSQQIPLLAVALDHMLAEHNDRAGGRLARLGAPAPIAVSVAVVQIARFCPGNFITTRGRCSRYLPIFLSNA